MRSGVYRILNIFSGRSYIGSSVRLDERWKDHRNSLQRHEHHCRKLQSDWIEYGADAFEFEILEFTAREKIALMESEQSWLDKIWPDCYNSAPRAYSNAGVKHTERAKQRNRAAKLGSKRSPETHAKIIAAQTGLKRSDETKRRIALSLTGKRLSAEHREKVGAARRGRVMGPLSEEHKQKLSTILRGRKQSEELIRKLSLIRRGRKLPHTPEWNAAIAASQRGKVISAETRAKISAALTGRPGTPLTDAQKQQRSEAAKRQHAKRREALGLLKG